MQSKLPRGYKIPNFSKFFGELEESIVEHVAWYQIKCGDFATIEYLQMKYFPSSLIKSALTRFTTLPPNLIFNWAQLERTFRE